MATEITLKAPFEGTAAVDEPRVKHLEKAYKELKTQIIEQDKEVIKHQIDQLKEFQRHTQQIKKKTAASIHQCDANVQKLQDEATKLDVQVKAYQNDFKNKNKEEQYKQEIAKMEERYVNICKQRIEKANSIDCKKLEKVDIEDRKSTANQVFKWVLVAIYNEPQSKYYWPNFKEQAFEEDKGVDLKERLGKVSALQAKEEAKIKTVSFIKNYATIAQSEQLKDVQAECQKIRDVAVLFQESFQIGGKIKDNEKLIQTSKKSSLQADQGNLRTKARFDALTDRIAVIKIYQNQLKAVDRSLAEKEQKYTEKINESEKFITQIGTLSTIYAPTVNTQEKRDECQCAVY